MAECLPRDSPEGGGGGEAPTGAVLNALVWTPANVGMVGVCALVAFGAPRSAEIMKHLVAWKVAVSILLLVLALCLMFAQGFNPFLYFQF